MVRYRKPTERSSNLEDRRGSPGRRAAGIGLGGGGLAIIVAIVMSLLGGGGGGLDLGPVLDQLSPSAQAAPAEAAPLPPEADPDADMVDYMSVVLDDNQAFWDDVFGTAGLQYRDAKVVLFEGATESGCGGADERYGPHYCPLDENVYLDLDFFRELQTRFGARGDFAPAYVLSHEIGHHVQNVLRINEQVRNLQQQNPSDANQLSVRLELQADCFAGVWAASVFVDSSQTIESGRTLELDPGEISEALEAAAAVGDDRIQEAATGRIDPESWTHGSAEQRQHWFTNGYESGDPNVCDTFSGDV